MAKKIYVFKNGVRPWADYKLPAGIDRKNILRTFDLTHPNAVIKDPGNIIPDRVKALAERALAEAAQVVEVPVVPTEKKVHLSWKQRLKWLFTGKL